MTMMRGALAALVATVVCGLVAASPVSAGTSTVGQAVGEQAVREQAVNRVVDTVLRSERYTYRRESWRILETDGLPRWLVLRDGRLSGTSPRLGTWRITLEERGTGKQRGERRRTVLVLKSVTQRAASGTVLITRGIDGRPANGASWSATVSGDGSTVVFVSSATNLVRGVRSSAGPKIHVWDSASDRVSLLPSKGWADIRGISHDGRRVLVDQLDGLVLLDRTSGTVTRVAEEVVEAAALTADGERVFFQDGYSQPGSEAPRLVEWARATGVTRTVVQDVQTRTLAGVSAGGRFALFIANGSSELLDTSTGTFGDLGPLGVEYGGGTRGQISDDGRLLSLHARGIPTIGGRDIGDSVGLVHDTLLGTSRGPALRNAGAAITADGSHYAVATARRHLRVVDRATGTRTSVFTARPSGQEGSVSLSDDVSRVAYVSDGHDLLRGTRRGVANVYVWVRAG